MPSAPDVAVAVSPSFLGLFPVLASARLRRFPWILWLEDILPDAAAATGSCARGSRFARPSAWNGSCTGGRTESS